MKNTLATASISLLPLVLSGAAAAVQTLGQGPADDISIWRVAGALLLCLLLAVGGALAIRARRGGSLLPLSLGRNRRLSLIESLRVGQHCEICIASCDGREFLLLTSAEGGSLLCDLGKARQSPEGDPL